MALVNSLCYMLATTPFQRENYSRLIIGIIVQYYQKSNSHYKGEIIALRNCFVFAYVAIEQISSPRIRIPMDACLWQRAGVNVRIF